MPDTPNSRPDCDEALIYQIRIKGHLAEDWAGWFEGLNVTLEDNGVTLLTGAVRDQAALHGLLKKVRDLGLPLISVSCLDPDRIGEAEIAAGKSTISTARGASE